jgi:hypothetical protein
MSRPFHIQHPEQAYLRTALFAVELLDAVTLERVTMGVKVTAEGLGGKPRVNATGLFVWLEEELSPLRKLTIDPGALPYEKVERLPSDLQLPPAARPVTTIELPPRTDYPFAPGITGARGALIESRLGPRVAVVGAEVRWHWLDEDGLTWRIAPTVSHTTTKGDFVSVLRLTPAEVPHVDSSGAVTARLWARREGAIERRSADLKLPQGRIADSLTSTALTFAWDELQP